MGKRRGGVTRRGLLWAGGLAASPLPPVGSFSPQADEMPWDAATADTPRAPTKPLIPKVPRRPVVTPPPRR